VAIAGLRIPVDEGGRMLVNFRRGSDPFAYYSVSDIIHHLIAPEKLAEKIVLVGATAHGLGDRGVTPVNGYMPRVEIHANAIDNIVQGDFIRRTPEGREIAFFGALILGLLMAAGVAGLSAMASAALGVILAVGYYTYAQARLTDDGLVIPVVFPMLVALATYMALAGFRYITEGLEKRHLRHAFEHYLHPDVISAVIENRDGLKLGGERRHMTILFADIVNYTGLSEKTDPAALVALLNNYMTKMTDHIMENDGVVDKIRGDGIMAFWGAPLDVPNHAHLAIESGIAMLAELSVMQKSDPRFAELDIGVGIATGDCIVGNFGGERRFDYSVIGDIVNLASRLEGLTRQFKVHLLVSLDTYTEAGAGFIGRELGLVKVKGKELFVPVVDVAGRANDSVDPAFYNRFALALKMIRGGSARTAISELEHLSEERPNDTPVKMYLERLAADPDHPPSEMVFEFDTK
jgi:adenylate cyclase